MSSSRNFPQLTFKGSILGSGGARGTSRKSLFDTSEVLTLKDAITPDDPPPRDPPPQGDYEVDENGDRVYRDALGNLTTREKWLALEAARQAWLAAQEEARQRELSRRYQVLAHEAIWTGLVQKDQAADAKARAKLRKNLEEDPFGDRARTLLEMNFGHEPPAEVIIDQDEVDKQNDERNEAQKTADKIDKGGGLLEGGGRVTYHEFRDDDPCATLKNSKAMSDGGFDQGEYPDGEIAYWNSMLNDPNVPNEIKDKIRAWNGARNRAKELNQRGGNLTLERFLKDWDNGNIDFAQMFSDIVSGMGDWAFLQIMIDEAINEAITGVPFITPEFDVLEYLDELSKEPEDPNDPDELKKRDKRLRAEWVMKQIGINISAMMFRDIFANLYEAILSFAQLALDWQDENGNRSEMATLSPFEFLEQLFAANWNANGDLVQASGTMDGLEDYAYYDMVGSWMGWYRENDKEYNRKNDKDDTPWSVRCADEDSEAAEEIEKRKENSLKGMIRWLSLDYNGGLPTGGSIFGQGGG